MDFTGNAGRHKLVHAVDILGGKISERTRELIERKLKESGRPVRVSLAVPGAYARSRLGALRSFDALRLQFAADLIQPAVYRAQRCALFSAWHHQVGDLHRGQLSR
jgi:hypothetical protein